MDAELQAVTAKLLLTAHLPAGYPVPDRAPMVELVPPKKLGRGRASETATSAAPDLPGRGVLLSDALDPVDDDVARAVLLHELVHAAQGLRGAVRRAPALRALPAPRAGGLRGGVRLPGAPRPAGGRGG